MKSLIDKVKSEWSSPRRAIENGKETDFEFICEFNSKLNSEINDLPSELVAFYRIANGATLFKDVEFGQWGLKIFSVEELKVQNGEIKEWRDDLSECDLIIGYFLGDSDLIVISLSEEDCGMVIICTPMDPRKEWYHLKINFEEFLERYIKGEGDKFWES